MCWLERWVLNSIAVFIFALAGLLCCVVWCSYPILERRERREGDRLTVKPLRRLERLRFEQRYHPRRFGRQVRAIVLC